MCEKIIIPIGSNVETETEVAVHQGGGWGLSDDLNGSEWLQDAFGDTIKVDRLEATNSMTVTDELLSGERRQLDLSIPLLSASIKTSAETLASCSGTPTATKQSTMNWLR
jgi:hypothetical protein